ncbi:hypothetical protein MNB_SM-3-1506 [hydrothermal vent metagenome]|uniref:Periplasmic protein n=1 Tax=hydrothermal vent metagenome TaxID=652676 RepID=A0A1W1D2N6_9ZZZZ
MLQFLKWFAPIFTIGVAIFIVFFLIQINKEDGVIQTKQLSLPKKPADKNISISWLEYFSKTKKQGYSYPVNEVYVKVDLNEKIIKTITYKLSAPLLDPYQLFCLKEELKHYKIKYDLRKNKRAVELVIYSKNKEKLQSLVKRLKNYQIVAKIKPYKEEIE